ncbi:tetratricopeptide repeat protein [Halomonas sp. LR3S48]|uniref:O-linked N-acetylglucosamine transferase, SPINDLY family protein n=1 Tax=Halomonas sp. LR3S48 TaxID=2982694 RepID=UPI0021E37750|nr:tetratricopeptide repeat protein [Halomonas sp. LR3S48]UYG02080.1 tetratricopeptide repeat protein [Halomonas sp. LR3S48]
MSNKQARRGSAPRTSQAISPLPVAQVTAFETAFYAGDYSKALRLAEAMLERHPHHLQAWELKTNALGRLERLDEACDAMGKVVELASAPDTSQYLKLAQYQVLAGRAKDALKNLDEVLKKQPDHIMALAWLSRAYHQLGDNGKALEINDRAMLLDSYHEEALLWRSRILDQLKLHDDCMRTLETLLKVNPKRIGLNNHMATLFVKEGDYHKAEALYAKELELTPENGKVYSNLLVAAHYNPVYSAEEIFLKAIEWDRRFSRRSSLGRAATQRDVKKRLRIGLLSGGLRVHPVGQMILPALQHLSRQQFELFAYSTSQIVDKLTQQILGVVHHWDVVEGLGAGQLDQKIRDDNIDILIDMNGAGEGTRYDTLTREPAPLIVKWVGSLISTTGLSCFDYLLSDSIETPEGVDELYVEKLIRLPDDYICYHIPEHAPSCNALPALSNGYITFGCLNNPAKLSPPMLAEWAKLLKEIPDGKLLLRGIQFESARYCEKIISIFVEHGVAADRLLLEGPAQHQEFMATYQRIDIALDTWPYSGGLTTCEALMMGVPVVTHVGPTFAGRHSASHLVNAGLPELVTENWDDFRQRAKELASDLPNLAVIRAALRTILTDSPICDGPRFANHLTAALRAIWQRHCEGKAPEALTFSKSGVAQFVGEDEPAKLVLAQPEDGFDWQLESPVLAVDNGAVLASRPDARELLGSGRIAMLSFDPDSRLQNAEHLAQYGEIQHFPGTSLGNGQPVVNAGTEQIPSVALNAIEGLPNIDLLCLSDSHDNLTILQHGSDNLKNTLLLEVRVIFNPAPSGKSEFGTIAEWANQYGFRFYRFNNMDHRSRLPDSMPVDEWQATELSSADALFLPSGERLKEMPEAQRVKLAFLLHALYNVKDMAYSLLSDVDVKKAEAYLLADRASASPSEVDEQKEEAPADGGFSVPEAPFMSEPERDLFKKALRQSSRYFEFGSGGSSVWAVQEGLTVHGVESDAKWVGALKRKLGEMCQVEAVDIGPTKEWGFPVTMESSEKFPAYSQAIHLQEQSFDLILVDGRFRVACTMAAIQHILANSEDPQGARIFIHDFWNRPNYHVVLEFLEVEEKAESAGLFRVKSGVRQESVAAMWEQYAKQPQ